MKIDKNLVNEFMMHERGSSKTPVAPKIDKEGYSLEDVLQAILEELESLKDAQKKLLAENYIVPKSSQEVFLKVAGVLFKGTLEQVQ